MLTTSGRVFIPTKAHEKSIRRMINLFVNIKNIVMIVLWHDNIRGCTLAISLLFVFEFLMLE